MAEFYDKFVGQPISSFFENCNAFEHFSVELKQKKKAFIWKDGELEDFLLSKTEKRSDICDILHVAYTDDIPSLKKSIYHALNKGLSQKKEEEFAAIIKDFDDIPRLKSFLED